MLPLVYGMQSETVRAARDLGVQLYAGSDAPTHMSFPGISLHWELEYLVNAGISPINALRIATIEAAEAVGAEEDLGSVTTGKLADLVILDANPLEDITNSKRIWRVVKGGWVFDPDVLAGVNR